MCTFQVLEEEHRIALARLADYLHIYHETGGYVHRYDGMISPVYEKDPHLDLHLYYLYNEAEHDGRKTCTKLPRNGLLAELTLSELAYLSGAAGRIAGYIPGAQVMFSRFEEGRCVFTITVKKP